MRQHFLFAAWENKEGRSGQKGIIDPNCLEGNQRKGIPSNQLATFLFLLIYEK